MNSKPKAFKSVVKEYSGMAYQLAYRFLGSEEEAKEVVQEAFIKLYRNWSEFSPEKNLKNWLYTITLNTARDYYRKHKRRSEVGMHHFQEGQELEGIEGGLHRKNFVHQMLSALDPELKEVVILYYIEGRSITEVEGVLGISKSLVKIRLFRARKFLLEKFKDESHGL